MSGVWLPLAATAGAAAVTYLSCVRPMLRHGGCVAGDTAAPAEPDPEVAELTEQVRLLRDAQDLHEAEAHESA